MTIYSLYIFDRHCACVYYQDWHRTVRPKIAVEGGMLPAVYAPVYPQANPETMYGNRNTLSAPTSGIVVAVNDDDPHALLQTQAQSPIAPLPPPPTSLLSFDEEAKLVYGVVLSLRNMIKKLSGKDEQFVNYQTSTYKLHLFETLSGYKFVMLSDPAADSLRFVLRQIYSGPFLEYVVRNPLVEMDSKERGIDNEYFRMSTDRLVRGLTVFQ
ncbi:snare-like protein [Lentinus tigrinus ALCF2SS1-7]|uniref:Trafficking protein particle complex subunit n=1 Tax=Lentinus tigrinus ALCF2SS1-6 TaxID=1328759 RepID=A0A5C2RSP3_9APHY|nr:snare-like protein [Lentinus tigrinus ALCF2SS1-6]RPD74185.1 snare-like protein [Lentinus tigrinus ALCF2SS1-7]